jgi:hypothetical protein
MSISDEQILPALNPVGDRLREFCLDSLRKVSWTYAIWLIMAGIIALLVYLLKRDSPLASIRPALFVYYLVAAGHIAFRWKKGGTANILSPDIIFLLFYTLFHLGYVVLYDLGLTPYHDPPFHYETSIPRSLFVINLGLVSFLLGYEILGSRGGELRAPGPPRIPRQTWCVLGLVIMTVGVGMHVSVLGSVGIGLFRTYGYEAFANIHNYTRSFLIILLWRYSFQIVILGLAIHAVSSSLRYGKLFRSRLALLVLILFSLLLIMEGDRGPLLQMGTLVLLIRHYLVKRVRLHHLVLISIAVFVLFTAMRAMRTYVFEPTRMLEEYKYQKGAGETAWTTPFLEAGNSYLVVNITCHEVPSQEPYWKGASWKIAVFRMIPFLEGFALRHGWSTWSPSEWVTITYYGPTAAGRGFSISAEGYLNFGYLGVIVEMMFLGMFIRWVTVRFSNNPSAAWGILMIACIGISAGMVRAQISNLFGNFPRFLVAVVLLDLLLGNEPLYGHEEAEDPTILAEGDTSYAETIY